MQCFGANLWFFDENRAHLGADCILVHDGITMMMMMCVNDARDARQGYALYYLLYGIWCILLRRRGRHCIDVPPLTAFVLVWHNIKHSIIHCGHLYIRQQFYMTNFIQLKGALEYRNEYKKAYRVSACVSLHLMLQKRIPQWTHV